MKAHCEVCFFFDVFLISLSRLIGSFINMLITLLSILICVFYSILVFIFTVGWKRMPLFQPIENYNPISKPSASVVVACKNEEHSLPNLLSRLQLQSCTDFELILVNDHSTDSTIYVMEAALAKFENVKVINAMGDGKKNALKEGISIATGSLIITTDADCTLLSDWLMMICSFQQSHVSDLIICPVQLFDNKSLFARLQAFEFTTLVAAGAGAVGAGMPILCNGANLAFTKQAWLESKHDLVDEQMSGDDIFLLQSIKKRGGVIRFLKSESAIVFTEPAKTFTAFFKQRRRWASKSPAYSDVQLIVTTCVVFGISSSILILMLSSLFSTQLLFVSISIFGIKYLVDVFFLYSVRSFFHVKHLWFYSFLLSILYPFYILSVAGSALVFKSKSWK